MLPKILKTHISDEFWKSVKCIKFVCMYANKGSDMVVFGLQKANKKDEITCYQMACYISNNEAACRLFNFLLYERYPTVVHLVVHLETGQRIYSIQAILNDWSSKWRLLIGPTSLPSSNCVSQTHFLLLFCTMKFQRSTLGNRLQKSERNVPWDRMLRDTLALRRIQL